MVVIGRSCFVFDGVHDCTCDVETSDLSIGTEQRVPLVDSAVDYTCPYTHETYVLIARNALYVTSMDNNLITTFILREAGVNVCDNPNIHFSDTESRDHVIKFPDSYLLITL